METSKLLNEGEKLLLECRPESKLVLNMMVMSVVQTIVFIIVIAIYLAFNPKHLLALTGEAAEVFKITIFASAVIVIIYFAAVYVICRIKVSHLRYIFTDQRCIIYSGFIGVNKRVIPYNRVADIDITQSTLQAIFGLSEVFIDEQAMNYNSFAIVTGLSRDTAEEITKLVSLHITKKQA